ncbi:MAG: nuclear transport factor 2 family protein [Pseudomonadota bacterium]
MKVPSHLSRHMLAATLALAMATPFVGPVHAQQANSAAVEQLLAKQAIYEQIVRYPRGLDRGDRDLLLSIAHPGARMRFGSREFPSWEAYVDWLIKAHDEMKGNNHRMSNILIEVNGDRAVSETTGTATLLVPKEGNPKLFEERWMHSRYLDTWSRKNGKWALDSRHTVSDYRRVLDVPADLVNSRYEVIGHTGRNDPSYPLFESLKK